MATPSAFGQALEQARLTAGPNGKKITRVDLAQQIGLTPAKITSIERGRQPRPEEYSKIIDFFPALADIDTAAPATPTTTPTATDNTVYQGQLCITCYAPYSDTGQVNHKPGCPMNLRPAERPPLESAAAEPPPDTADVPDIRSAEGMYGDLVALDASECDMDESPAPAPAPKPDRRYISLSKFPPESQDDVVLASNSELQAFKRCRRKWWLGWYRKLELRTPSPAGALAIGNRIHRALQAWYVPADWAPQDPRQALEAAITQDWAAAVEAYGKTPMSQVPPEIVKEFSDDTAMERVMIEGYMQWLEETGVDTGLKVVASETYLQAPLEIPGLAVAVMLIGKLDVRVVRESDGVRLFIDHKSVGSLKEPLKTIRLNEQMLHYLLLEYLQGVQSGRCDGALYNMLRKVKRTSRAVPPFYDRVEVRHNQHELDAFRDRLIGTIRDLLAVRTALDVGANPMQVVYPTPNKNCAWDCEFLPVCPMFDDGSRVQEMVEYHYKTGDPNARYRENEER